MSPKLTIKIALTSVLLLSIFVANLVGFIPIHLPFVSSTAVTLEAINGVPYTYAPYINGKTPVISLGDVKNPDNAYIHLNFRFRADSIEGNQNIFQTAPVNSGMRMEISGSTAAIVVPDLLITEGLKGLVLTTEFKTAQWYTVEVEALNGAYVRVKLNGQRVSDYTSAGISMKTSQILLGSGFNATRVFRGQIDNISITKGNHPAPLYKSHSYLFAFYAVLLIGILILLADYFLVNEFTIGLTSVLCSVLLYNVIFFNKYFPLTEGWFSAYSHLIRQGLVPYRDFYLFLTPLYPLQLAAFQSVFGESFFALRILGIAVVLLIALFVYLILVNRFSPPVSVIATVSTIVYYQSGVAHITYDFIQFVTLYVLVATYLIIRYTENNPSACIDKFNKNAKYLFLAGVMVSLAFLTKQSNGTLTVIFSIPAVFLATAGQSRISQLKHVSVYMLGMFLPVLFVGIWLFLVGALLPFIDQVAFGAIDAKGTISSILFSWIGRHANWDYLMQLKLALLYMSPLFALSLIVTALPKDWKMKVKIQSNSIREIFLFFAMVGATLWFAYYGSEITRPWMLIPGIKLSQGVVVVSTAFVVALIVISVARLSAGINLRKNLMIIAIMTLGLVFGNGTSAGIDEVGVFLGFALALAFLMSLPNVTGVAKAVVGAVCLSFILLLTNAKFAQPYAWWYLSVPDIRESTTFPALPLMAGFRLSPGSAKVLEDTTRIIQTHSRPGDDVFTFPNIPGFYVLADRWPHSKVMVSWFDFLPDKFARAEASRLRASPPAIIANLKLPEAAWTTHESLFRDGKPLGQRDIQAAIMELTEQRKLYQLDFAREVSPGCVLEVWHKKIL